MSGSQRSLCLLALDGGGVRGYSELIILRQLMQRIQRQNDLPYLPKPCQIFDLICGTSTGGLIALMLGRLKMSVDEVISEYDNVAKRVFGIRKHHISEGRYKATNLEKVIHDTVRKYGMPQQANGQADPYLKLRDDQIHNSCKVFVCSRSALAMNSVRLFRSYPSFSVSEYEDMTICQAARATSAAPTFFKRLEIGPEGAQEEFLDGGLGSNNPTKILIDEALREFGSEARVACIISVGTGKTGITEFRRPGYLGKAIPLDLINVLKYMATDCAVVAADMAEKFYSRPGIYYRFNVEHGLEDILMDEWKELENIKIRTVKHLEQYAVDRTVNEAAHALHAKEPLIKLSELNSTLPSMPPASSADAKLPLITKCIVPFERRIPSFIGHEDVLDKIRATLHEANLNQINCKPVVLRTMGGQGKTQLALEYCRRAQNEDYDFVLWADAETRISLQQSFTTIAKGLPQRKATSGTTVPEITAMDETTLLDLVRAGLQGKKCLMVIDNLDLPSEHPNIKRYMTLAGVSHIIITSRHLDAERLGSKIALPAFSVQEGNKLLIQRSGREGFSDDACARDQIVFALGGLPLGIDQAALLIREKSLTYPQFLKAFQETRTTLLQDEDPPAFWEYEEVTPDDDADLEKRKRVGVQTAWVMSFSHLKNLPNGKSKCHLLTLSAYLSSTKISQAIFTPFLRRVKDASTAVTAIDSELSTHPANATYPSHLELHIVSHARSWAEPLLEDSDAYTANGVFSNFVYDAFKLGLVCSIQHDETLGTTYSIHPLVSRWLVDQDCDKCFLEALIITAQLLIRSRTIKSQCHSSMR